MKLIFLFILVSLVHFTHESNTIQDKEPYNPQEEVKLIPVHGFDNNGPCVLYWRREKLN